MTPCMVESTAAFLRGLSLISTSYINNSQPSQTPVPGYLISPFDLCKYQECTCYREMHAGSTCIHMKNTKINKSKTKQKHICKALKMCVVCGDRGGILLVVVSWFSLGSNSSISQCMVYHHGHMAVGVCCLQTPKGANRI